MKRVISIVLFTIVAVGGNCLAQTCGFGCLGMSGVYGGYSIQEYEPEGLNKFLLNRYGTLPGDENEVSFSKSEGFRVGANIFRADFGWAFLTAKGFYQFLQEEKYFEPVNNGSAKLLDNYILETNYWGFGFDLGISVFEFLDLKIIDGGITFLQVDFYDKQYQNNVEIYNRKYQNSEVDVGGYIGSGLVVNLVPDYLSIEGTAQYTFMKISNLEDEEGNNLITNSIHGDLITGGGFSATVQLNIGFPL